MFHPCLSITCWMDDMGDYVSPMSSNMLLDVMGDYVSPMSVQHVGCHGHYVSPMSVHPTCWDGQTW